MVPVPSGACQKADHVGRDQEAQDITARGAKRVGQTDALLGRAREYRLIYRLVFSVTSSGEAVIDRSNIQLTRNLLFNPEAVLGVAEETQNIYRDMIRDSTGQILLRLQALQ